jgi:mevalonate kinase
MTTAHAKVILFGEHAVVHGRLAVAAALDRGARARAKACDGGASTAKLSPWGHVARSTDDDDLGRAFQALLDRAGARGRSVEAEVDVEVPGGAGLGCSAAIGVALAYAVGDALDAPLDVTTATDAATAWERVFHGNPSGIDVAAAIHGGVLAFRRGESPRRVSFPEPIDLAVASTGEASSTKAMVEQVARQLARRPQVVNRTFDGIDQLATKGLLALEAARWWELGQMMDLNHALLASLMVSTERLELACNTARGAGAMGAKLTGGGGGGCAVALAPGKIEEVLEAWRRVGIEGFSARIAPSTIVTSLEASP